MMKAEAKAKYPDFYSKVTPTDTSSNRKPRPIPTLSDEQLERLMKLRIKDYARASMKESILQDIRSIFNYYEHLNWLTYRDTTTSTHLALQHQLRILADEMRELEAEEAANLEETQEIWRRAG
ncbi:hypothetical protein N7457_005561 [Penicillium paradoxum]|uniref:uncharacterized protein n=1 Tax=Penicillium paradoxum TaxID=176176 RepID=UPI0025465C20|nr:uncharacterized protein N7457_005561 [Penicillium paradoxum]KAJ5780401.1 hypothetical protein N7457_005561 [Penicillium paradoxum]